MRMRWEGREIQGRRSDLSKGRGGKALGGLKAGNSSVGQKPMGQEGAWRRKMVDLCFRKTPVGLSREARWVP